MKYLYLIACVMLAACSSSEEEPTENTEVFQNSPEEESIQKEPIPEEVEEKDELDIPQMLPKNERQEDSDLKEFIEKIEQAILKKDTTALLSLMDDKIISSHGGAIYGHEGFIENWSYPESNLWKKLDRAVSLGGYFENEISYVMPYCHDYNGALLPGAMPYGIGVCTSPTTKLYMTESLDLKGFLEINYAMVEMVLDENYVGAKQDGVYKVKPVNTNLIGFVKVEDVFIVSDYTLTIRKREDGNWKIVTFAPWD